jgi:hypothetical protein
MTFNLLFYWLSLLLQLSTSLWNRDRSQDSTTFELRLGDESAV